MQEGEDEKTGEESQTCYWELPVVADCREVLRTGELRSAQSLPSPLI